MPVHAFKQEEYYDKQTVKDIKNISWHQCSLAGLKEMQGHIFVI